MLWSIAAGALAAAPFGLVAAAQRGGELPDQALWFAQSNHGPWRWGVKGCVVLMAFYGLVGVAAGSLLHGVVGAVRQQAVRVLTPFVATSVFAGALLGVVLWRFVWLVD
jgi:hypothetical protein